MLFEEGDDLGVGYPRLGPREDRPKKAPPFVESDPVGSITIEENPVAEPQGADIDAFEAALTEAGYTKAARRVWHPGANGPKPLSEIVPSELMERLMNWGVYPTQKGDSPE